MLRLPARTRPVADFVMTIAGVAWTGPGVIIHIRRQIGVGLRQTTFGNPPAQGRSLLQRQGIQRQMLRGQRQRLRHRIPPLAQRLAGQPVHQIQIDVVKARPPAGVKRRHGLRGVMPPAQHRQQAVVHTLRPDADAVDPGRPQPGRPPRRQVIGVALGGYLRIPAHRVAGRHGLQNAGHAPVGQVRRRAPAQKNGIDPRTAQRHRPGAQLGGNRIQKVANLPLNSLVGVEIAVGALGKAKGDVDVQRNAAGQPRCRPFLPFRRRGHRN